MAWHGLSTERGGQPRLDRITVQGCEEVVLWRVLQRCGENICDDHDAKCRNGMCACSDHGLAAVVCMLCVCLS